MQPHPAIVSTVRDAGPVLDSFVAYHLGIGFERIYLFFDDPDDPSLDRFAKHDRVTAVACDAEVRAAWQRMTRYDELTAHIKSEVMARQILNCELAINKSRQDGIDWIMHIDSDELFLSRTHVDVRELFDQLSASNVTEAIFQNFEAVPEATEIRDYFREVTLFKTNPMIQGKPRFSPSALAAIESNGVRRPEDWFCLYSNGKSAARVDERLLPVGVHRFGRFVNSNEVPSRSAEFADGNLILHYPNCGYENFVTKYQTLGAFADKWFDRDDILPFHREARDVVARGDAAEKRQFYEQRVMLAGVRNRSTLMELGVLERISGPAENLAKQAPAS